MKYLITILLTGFLSFSSCQTQHRKPKELKIRVYQVKDVDDDWLWVYILELNPSTYYSYTSQAPTSTFSTISWAKSDISPLQSYKPEEIQENQEIVEEFSDFSEDFQSDFEDTNLDESPDFDTEDTMDVSDVADTDSGDSGFDGGDSGGGDGGSDGGGGE